MDNTKNELVNSLLDELHDVVKYSELAKHDEYGSILKDIAHEEMQHAEHIKHILKAEGVDIPDMHEHWEAAEHALYGDTALRNA